MARILSHRGDASQACSTQVVLVFCTKPTFSDHDAGLLSGAYLQILL